MNDPYSRDWSARRLDEIEFGLPRVGLRLKPDPSSSAGGSEPVKHPRQYQVLSRTCPHMRHSWFAQAGRPPPPPELLAVEARKTLFELLEGVVPRAHRPKVPIHEPSQAASPARSGPATKRRRQRLPDGPPSYRRQVRDRARVLKLFDNAVRHANPPAQGAGLEGPSPSFELFPGLPPELRLMIWEYALALGRARALTGEPWLGEMTHAWSSRLAMPRMARVNREARGVALTAFRVTQRSRPLADILRGWALPGDFLEVRAVFNNPATADGLEQDMAAFASLATNIGCFLEHSDSSHRIVSRIPKTFKRVRTIQVTLQTINIIIKPGDRAARLAKELALDKDQPFVSTDVEPDGPSAATDLCVYKTGLIGHEAESVRIATVVALSDRARIEELLAIGRAIGQFGDDLGSRLLAMESHSTAYCLDHCLQRWWLAHGLPLARTMFVERTDPGSPQPDFVPAVRFRFVWPQNWEKD